MLVFSAMPLRTGRRRWDSLTPILMWRTLVVTTARILRSAGRMEPQGAWAKRVCCSPMRGTERHLGH